MPTLRPWTPSPSELKWAVGIVCICLIILIALPFFPKKQQGVLPGSNNHQPTTHIAKKELTKTIVQAQQTHSKQIHKQATASIAKRSVSMPSTQKQQIEEKHAMNISKAYFIQIGAFQDKKHAYKLQKQLSNKHWPAIIQKKKHLYAVQIGPYSNKDKAKRIKKKFAQQEHMSGFITHHAHP